MGTQHVVVETIRALGRNSRIDRLVALTPPTLPPYAKALAGVAARPLRRRTVWRNCLLACSTAIVYRPYQVGTLRELDALRRFGARVVVNHLDVIAFSNPAYFRSGDAWLDYREVTRLAFATVDGVAFISESGREFARSLRVCSAATSRPRSSTAVPMPRRPSSVRNGLRLLSKPRMTTSSFAWVPPTTTRTESSRSGCSGSSARGWRGRLVLAGPTPPDGNSLAAEAEEMIGDVDLSSAVVTLGAVSDAEKAWLLSHAALVLYPTLVEGFGLVPFEAAACGVPTLATRQGSLGEVLPADIPAIDVFDASRAADLAWDLLTDDDQAKAVVERIQRAGQHFTWDLTADRLVDLFEGVLRSPPRRTLVVQGESSAPVAVRPRILSRSSERAVWCPTRTARGLRRRSSSVEGAALARRFDAAAVGTDGDQPRTAPVVTVPSGNDRADRVVRQCRSAPEPATDGMPDVLEVLSQPFPKREQTVVRVRRATRVLAQLDLESCVLRGRSRMERVASSSCFT